MQDWVILEVFVFYGVGNSEFCEWDQMRKEEDQVDFLEEVLFERGVEE